MSSKWQRIGREPLVRFMALGALIFLAAHVMEREHESAARRIVVDAQLDRRIIEINEAQNGVTPTPAQLRLLVQSYVNDEMLYREALRMGLDRDDEIIRRRLIQKMQFLERDLAAVSAPAERELHIYYDSHPALFLAPAAVSFEQLFFNADRDGSAGAQVRAQHARAAIDSKGIVPTPGGSSDEFPISIPTQEITRSEASGIFGATAILDTLFATPEGQWSAPVRSEYGWHLVKVIHHSPPVRPPFEAVHDRLREEYLNDQSRAAEQRALATLRAHFEVVRSGKQVPRTS
jgi:peptidyl-prolyl cis-trans isomerase C